ncbi:hypothetical protein C0992_009003, partial [Termitomyces sp. T32_za158]
ARHLIRAGTTCIAAKRDEDEMLVHVLGGPPEFEATKKFHPKSDLYIMALLVAARSWLRTTAVRGLATASSARDKATHDLAMAQLGQIAVVTHAARPVPVAPPPGPTEPTLINIPPAEDPLLHYVTSHLMRHGHRARASRIVSNILLYIHAWTRAPPLPILRKAILDAAPAVRTLSHRTGGKTVFKPTALSEKKRMFFALKHIKDASRARSGRTIEERMAREMVNIVEGLDSEAVKAKRKMHEFATVNRFVYYLLSPPDLDSRIRISPGEILRLASNALYRIHLE